MRWWFMKAHNEVLKTVLQALPICICWNTWKNRCSTKYGNKQSSSKRVKYLVYQDLTLLLHTVFPYLQCPNSWRT
uniref:Putative ovule protein n=1 Tax=Solanum chacoense TaxID=4108 RepID=A0A0V0HN68_SOLCH